MSADNEIPPDLTPDERAGIKRSFAKALLHLGLGILLTLIYFWALIAWLVSGRDHAAISEMIFLAFGIGFFPIIGMGLYLLLGGMADCLIYAYYRRHPEAFRDRRADHRLWLLTPPPGIGRDSSTRKPKRAKSSTAHYDGYTPALSGDTSKST